jgi:hypothetical protein
MIVEVTKEFRIVKRLLLARRNPAAKAGEIIADNVALKRHSSTVVHEAWAK